MFIRRKNDWGDKEIVWFDVLIAMIVVGMIYLLFFK